MRTSLLLAAAAVLLASPALAAPGSTCIRHDQIDNWTALSDKQVVLEDISHHKVLVKLIGTCSDLKFHETLAVGGHGVTGLSCVEPGDTITTRNNGLGGRCAVVSVEPYTGSMTAHHDDHADADHGGDHHSGY